MKKSLIIISAAVVVYACGPKEKETKYPDNNIKERFEFIVDEEGSELKNGLYSEFYKNGQLKSKGYYEQGKRVGEWKEWHENGVVSRNYGLVNGEYDGSYVDLNNNGDTVEYIEYTKGLIDGVHKVYDEGNAIKKIQKYVAGRKQGKQIRYQDNGYPLEEYSIQDGYYDGDYVFYHSNGNIAMKGEYDKGKWVGDVVTFHPNGEKRSSATMKEGRIDGELNIWDVDGNMTTTIDFENGASNAFIGKWKLGNGAVYDFKEDESVFIRKNGNENKTWWMWVPGGKIQIKNTVYHIMSVKDDSFHLRHEKYLDPDEDVKATKIQ